MSTTAISGYSQEDLNSPYFKRNAGYRSLPGFPHIWVLFDGKEIWNAKTNRALAVTHKKGYPYVNFSGRQWRVQRLVLAAWYPGCLDDGSLALHRIPDRSYCAVWNLRPGTHKENVRDRMRDAGNIDADHCNRGHLLATGNLVPARLAKGGRACTACARAQARVSDAKRRKGADLSGDLQGISDSCFADVATERLSQAVAVVRFAVANPVAASRLAVPA